MSRNPYIAEGQPPTLRNSVLVFMDILGYTDLIKRSQVEKTQQLELIKLHEALTESRTNLEWVNNNDIMRGLSGKDTWT